MRAHQAFPEFAMVGDEKVEQLVDDDGDGILVQVVKRGFLTVSLR